MWDTKLYVQNDFVNDKRIKGKFSQGKYEKMLIAIMFFEAGRFINDFLSSVF